MKKVNPVKYSPMDSLVFSLGDVSVRIFIILYRQREECIFTAEDSQSQRTVLRLCALNNSNQVPISQETAQFHFAC